MSTRYPLPHSHPGRPVKRWSRPLKQLPEAHREVAAFTKANPSFEPMLRPFDRLCVECGADLFGGAVMGGGLVLAARSDVEMDEGVILIYFDPRKHLFSLGYRHRDVQPEQSEECPAADIWERLRLFLAYKFGIHRKPEPNSESCAARSRCTTPVEQARG